MGNLIFHHAAQLSSSVRFSGVLRIVLEVQAVALRATWEEGVLVLLAVKAFKGALLDQSQSAKS